MVGVKIVRPRPEPYSGQEVLFENNVLQTPNVGVTLQSKVLCYKEKIRTESHLLRKPNGTVVQNGLTY